MGKGDLSDAVRRNRKAVRDQIKQAAETEPPKETIEGQNGDTALKSGPMTKEQLRQFLKAHQERNPQDLFDELYRDCGDPFYVTARGVPTKVNERFWAEFLFRERILIYERDEERFYAYVPQSGCYATVTRAALKARLSDIWGEFNGTRCRGIKRLDAEGARRNVVELTSGIAEKSDFFVDPPEVLHCQNTMIQLGNGKVQVIPFSPEFRSRNQLNVAYKPEAKCKRFLGELLNPALDNEDQAVLQKAFGLIMLGVNRPQRIFMLDGESGTGKTTTARLVAALVGPGNYSELRTEHLVSRFEMARAFGRKLLFGPDVDAEFMQSAGVHRLKSLVGGDPMDAEKKNSNDHFSFCGILNILITSNSRLLVRLRGDLEAWLRRLVIIHFHGPGPGRRIDNFHEVLFREESSGILNWALSGLATYEKDHQQRGDIILTPEQQARVSSLLTESDGMRKFLTGEVVETEGASLTVDEIVQGYTRYSKARGWRAPRLQILQSQVADLMMEIHGISQSHNIQRPKLTNNGNPIRDQDGEERMISVRGYRGVRLRKEDDNDPEN